MFNNLIESSSHTREFKRRGSFLLFTTAVYGLLFVIAGVASIYAYDAHLEEQDTEFVTLISPLEFVQPQPPAERQPATTPNRTNTPQRYDERRVAMLSVNHPEVIPNIISTRPNRDVPIREGYQTLITGRNVNAELGGDPTGATRRASPLVIVVQIPDTPPPPPTPTPKPVPKVISKHVINSEAIELPKPPYPPIAIQIRLQGTVSVQVLIDESGRVVSAHAASGHPLLATEAVKAAYRARFSPTMIGDQPVRVSGFITYNFVLN
jgi:TonB family protein